MILFSCNHSNHVLHVNKDFTVYSDKVVQGEFISQVNTDGSMTSNYTSPLNTSHKRLIELKFSINQKDNELPFATNHQIVVKPQNNIYNTPLIAYGKQFIDNETGGEENLEPNTILNIRLDMNKVFNDFNTKGYYTDINNEKISKEDFKGVFVAGNVTPLNYDFENLGEDVQLKDEDGDHIYEISIKINTPDPDKSVKPQWELKKDISQYPQLKCNIPLIQSLYNMALEETNLLSEDDGTFRTGAKWAGVWTRDVSYATVLGMGIADTERARHSLLKKVKRDRIIQDTGSGGAWPVSSDRTTWALAAWEIYLITGDQLWLDYCYKVIKNSVEDDRFIVYDKANNLYKGESSFLDWRIQTYPRWMDNTDIYESFNLGTNLVHYQTLVILSKMAGMLNQKDEQSKYISWAEELEAAINQKLWNKDKGYYNQYIYGRNFDYTSTKSESLGEAFSVLFNVAKENASTVIENTPILTWGIPCVYPQIPEIRPYHNNGIWPFVQTFWNLASSKTGNGTALEYGISSFYRAAAMFLTNKENMVAENGDFITALNSDRQLWSVAGNLGHIYKIFFGMEFKPDNKLYFNPSIPVSYSCNMELSNLKIRNKEFEIKLTGYGNRIKSFKINGKEQEEYSVNLTGEGKDIIEIKMANNTFYGEVNLVANKFHLKTPNVHIYKNELLWDSIANAVKYNVYKDGSLFGTTTDMTKISLNNTNGEYTVQAYNILDQPSFISEPIMFKPDNKKVISFNKYKADHTSSIENTPAGMIELSKSKNLEINWSINIKEAGDYIIYFEYSNGSGPWNTDNKCANRTLWIDNIKTAPVIMPQRGTNEWSNPGETNRIKTRFTEGLHQFKINFEPENENMNFDTNTALLGSMKLIRL